MANEYAFISSRAVKNAYFISSPLMKYTFSNFMRWNKWHIHSKNFNFLFIIYNFKSDRFFALYDVIHVCTLRCIVDDIALCAMSTKTETTGARVEKVRISANLDYFIKMKFPCDLIKTMNTPALCFCLLIIKKVIGVWKSEVGSGKLMEKAEDIQFDLWNTTYIFTAVKYNLYFHCCEI